MDENERRRVQQHIYPRPPEEVIDTCVLWSYRQPEDQDWIRCGDFHTDAPETFRCGGPHRADVEGPLVAGPADVPGMDGKTYQVAQCPGCGRMFWGVKGEKPPPGWA
jgi:hypothetical protein